MKIQYVSATLISFMMVHAAIAEDYCSVIGYHEPNTQIYNGPTWCSDVKINNLIVRGPLNVGHSTLCGSTNVSGPIISNNAVFDSLTEKNLDSEKIYLKHASHVLGNIIFYGPRGKVYLSNTSWIHGKVINGVIIHN